MPRAQRYRSTCGCGLTKLPVHVCLNAFFYRLNEEVNLAKFFTLFKFKQLNQTTVDNLTCYFHRLGIRGCHRKVVAISKCAIVLWTIEKFWNLLISIHRFHSAFPLSICRARKELTVSPHTKVESAVDPGLTLLGLRFCGNWQCRTTNVGADDW